MLRVAEEYKKYGKPTMNYADIVVDGTKPINKIVREILTKTNS